MEFFATCTPRRKMIQLLSGTSAGNQEGETPSWTFPRRARRPGVPPPSPAGPHYPPGRQAAPAAGVFCPKAPLCKGSCQPQGWLRDCPRLLGTLGMISAPISTHPLRPQRRRSALRCWPGWLVGPPAPSVGADAHISPLLGITCVASVGRKPHPRRTGLHQFPLVPEYLPIV